MAGSRLIGSWIGHSDLSAMAAELPPARRGKLEQVLEKPPITGIQQGPIRTLVEQEPFDEIHLPCNYDPFLGKWYAKWLTGARTARAFYVSRDEIVAAGYDLFIGRHEEHAYENPTTAPPGHPATAEAVGEGDFGGYREAQGDVRMGKEHGMTTLPGDYRLLLAELERQIAASGIRAVTPANSELLTLDR